MPIPLLIPALGYGAAALGVGAAGLGVAGATGLKDDLGLGVQDRADLEVLQGKRKGYDPKTGKIKRGLWERATDGLLGNSEEAITSAAADVHLDNLTSSRSGGLISDRRPGFEITSRMTQAEIDKKGREIERRDPLITAISTTGELKDKYTVQELQSMDVDTLNGVLKQARQKEAVTDYTQNPVIQQQLADARQDRITADKRFNATQQLAITQMGIAQQQQANAMQIAQMNNQLQMRRQDSADRRSDRRDRQAMIQQLMGGLSALGTSIAI